MVPLSRALGKFVEKKERKRRKKNTFTDVAAAAYIPPASILIKSAIHSFGFSAAQVLHA